MKRTWLTLLAVVGVLVAAQAAVATSASAATCSVANYKWLASAPKTFQPNGFCREGLAGHGGKLIFQSDGNFVLYDLYTGKAVWSSGTSGRGEHLSLQSNGQVVVYGCTGQAGVGCSPAHAIWASGSNWGSYYPADMIQIGDQSNAATPCWAVVHSEHESTSAWSDGGWTNSTSSNCFGTYQASL